MVRNLSARHSLSQMSATYAKVQLLLVKHDSDIPGPGRKGARTGQRNNTKSSMKIMLLSALSLSTQAAP